MSEELPPDVRAALNASNKIEAIRLLRLHTGLGLRDAKEAVESGSLPSKPLARPTLPQDLPDEAVAALQRGRKIEAVKIVRAKFGIDLKAAKEIVDAAEAAGRHGGASSQKTYAPPVQVPDNRYGAAPFLLAIVVAALVAWWLFAGR